MALIDRYLPAYDVGERHEAFVAAPPERTYRVAVTVDLARARSVRGLFAVRAAISVVTPTRATNPLRTSRLTLDDLTASGFVVLEERPNEEIVLGAIGRFWRAAGELRRFSPAEFVPFDQPGYAKGVLNLRVRSAGDGGSALSTETRVLCTDPRSARAFRRYWRLVGPFSAFIRRRMLAMVKSQAEALARVEPGTMDPEG